MIRTLGTVVFAAFVFAVAVLALIVLLDALRVIVG